MPEQAEHPVRRGANGGAGVLAFIRTPSGLVILAAVAVVIGLAVWFAVRGGGDAAKTSRRATATEASAQRLYAFAGSVGHPIYWAGSQPSYTYELSRTKDGRVYIRYLPHGVKPGTPSPNYLTIGTYPQRNAFATLRASAKSQGIGTLHLAGGGLAFQYKKRPTSVYLAYPGSDYQIEVFDPSPKRALQLVTSGQIKPVGAPPRTASGSRAASPQQLKALAVTLGHPLYWAGAEPGDTYELTRTKDGSVYVRYLPPGVAVGVKQPKYLTIGTYPQKSALAILKATASKNHVGTFAVAGGGLAFVDRQHPTSVYLAYPGIDVQVEVFDPSAGQARRLVTSGQIAPLR